MPASVLSRALLLSSSYRRSQALLTLQQQLTEVAPPMHFCQGPGSYSSRSCCSGAPGSVWVEILCIQQSHQS